MPVTRVRKAGGMQCARETAALSLQPSPALVAFVRRQVSQSDFHTGVERRTEVRDLLVKPVLVYPADEMFSPVGPSQVMLIRDVSPRGLGLVHEDPLDCKRILVRISYPGTEAAFWAASSASAAPWVRSITWAAKSIRSSIAPGQRAK